MSNDNRPDHRHTITIERWDGEGDLEGCYLVSLLEQGHFQPTDGGIFGSKDEAYDNARDLMKVYPHAILHDQSEDGDR